ncbi:DNA polymerase beta superfamily protein [Lentzea sp.]|uniref:DNA polymerase beta superfamily protein n=1 Tax=Lentzea sp. TaxID=56099 RepID=UPI002ED08489
MILEAVVGSHAYGLATAESDVDRRGVFVAPAEAFWRPEKPPTSVEGKLGLKSNPTVLETLVSPLVEITTPLGEELRDLPWDDALAWAHRLGAEIAAARGPLPEEPDVGRVEDWLVSVRRRSL